MEEIELLSILISNDFLDVCSLPLLLAMEDLDGVSVKGYINFKPRHFVIETLQHLTSTD